MGMWGIEYGASQIGLASGLETVQQSLGKSQWREMGEIAGE